MAEALLRDSAGDRVLVAGAGSEPMRVHPLAVQVMAERGIDIRGQRSKHLGELAHRPWDVVVTVCDRVREVCPTFPAETRAIHWSVPDPAAVLGETERLEAFRAAADDLAQRVRFLDSDLSLAAS
jgi:protein-tyrosine-phosphatase